MPSVMVFMPKMVRLALPEIASHAPKIAIMMIDSEKIKDVIGRGGEMITKIILEASNVKTVNDKILVFLAFAFDLNYDYSKQTILEKGYYDKMFEHIKNKDKFKPYFDEVKKYLKGE